jgi:hypothetical protein
MKAFNGSLHKTFETHQPGFDSEILSFPLLDLLPRMGLVTVVILGWGEEREPVVLNF